MRARKLLGFVLLEACTTVRQNSLGMAFSQRDHVCNLRRNAAMSKELEHEVVILDPSFMKMVQKITSYSDAQVECVNEERIRALLRGVRCATDTSEVLASFSILYEDYAPIRCAGKILFDALDRKVIRASQTLREVRERIPENIGGSEEKIDALASIFRAIDFDGNGKLTPKEVKNSGILDVLQGGDEILFRNVEEFMRELDHDSDGVVTYLEFLEGSQMLFGDDIVSSVEDGMTTNENIIESDAVLQQILDTRSKISGNMKDRLDSLYRGSRREQTKHGDRYDNMLKCFLEWERDQGLFSDKIKSPRLQIVLKGCFVGARTPPVAETLKIVYEDFPPLRIAGNLIFKLMNSLVLNDRSHREKSDEIKEFDNEISSLER